MEEIKARSLVKQIRSATLEGAIAHDVLLEASFTRGLPGFSIVGLGDEAIKEAKERVKSALMLSGFQFPPLKITVNLSPGDLKKSGSQMDLPIALLIALQNDPVNLDGVYCFGELGLDGSLRSTPAIFALALSLARQGKLTDVLCDPQSAVKLARIPGVRVYAAATLAEAMAFFKTPQRTALAAEPLSAQSIFVDQPYYYETAEGADFAEVRGQTLAKRAALIAAAGFHNLALSGAPGCGKSMIIKRLAGILPPMSLGELLERASLESLEGRMPSFKAERPLRSPHHSSTKASIFGGGCNLQQKLQISKSCCEFHNSSCK
ncbi:MAG: magnesium chelatase domain-containing protein [Campylobacterales bacterium]